ncbi:nucleotidyltransferase family protein [Thermotoga sp. SG1]|uniref:nucleotidyltransferase family protein n=1 Tax=Thermotoga sp. SG1 TaxID=126739 RepID=UPI000C776046|nr:nucleotidyltransferase domain-containing protein [Thermotoga sp. SG1]PLV56769.1 DNA polymerase subunit beta [Thermotoga sp. SG1]
MYEEYIRAWVERKKKEEEKMKLLAQRALEEAKKVTSVLREKYGVKRVVLFGSLAKYLRGAEEFTERSDIDLAVEGLPKEAYFRVLSEINRLSEFEIDLIDLEGCPAFLRNLIEREGMEIEGRTDSLTDSGDR